VPFDVVSRGSQEYRVVSKQANASVAVPAGEFAHTFSAAAGSWAAGPVVIDGQGEWLS
jgi:hypothetical protein